MDDKAKNPETPSPSLPAVTEKKERRRCSKGCDYRGEFLKCPHCLEPTILLEGKEASEHSTHALQMALEEAVTENVQFRIALKHYARRYDKDGKCWNWNNYVCDSYSGESSHFDWHGDEQDEPWEIAERVLSEHAPKSDNAPQCDICGAGATRRSDTFLYCDKDAPKDSNPI